MTYYKLKSTKGQGSPPVSLCDHTYWPGGCCGTLALGLVEVVVVAAVEGAGGLALLLPRGRTRRESHTTLSASQIKEGEQRK